MDNVMAMVSRVIISENLDSVSKRVNMLESCIKRSSNFTEAKALGASRDLLLNELSDLTMQYNACNEAIAQTDESNIMPLTNNRKRLPVTKKETVILR